MSKVKTFVSMFTASVVTAAIVASPALAWHPKGSIVKYVQNQTTNGQMSDANTAATAVAAKPGDILKYTIVVSNTGEQDNRGYNDMAKTVLTDTLPAGVELVNDPSTRTVTVDLGTIKPGQKVTKEYLVKVTASQDGTIENKACFTGQTTNSEPQNAQKGCDVANVKVTVPVTPPEQPKTPETPKAPETPKEAPAELPNTGSTEIFGGIAGASGIGYASYQYLRSKRTLAKSHRR